MADLTIWISGADFIEIESFLASEGSKIEVDRGRDSVWPISRRTEAC